jgi:MarR family transcriptional regulator, organic hydroperoxide resistance regulator
MYETKDGVNNKAKLIKEIVHLEAKLSQIIGPPHHKAWMELELTIGQVKSLFYLQHEGSTNLGQLATALEVTPPNVTGIIERLVEQGLVSRTENPENRRMLMVQLTEKGRDLIMKLHDSGSGMMSLLLNRLSVADLQALVQGITAIINAAADIPLEHSH